MSAADVRADWREGIFDRIPPEELTAKFINSYSAQVGDSGDGVVFWLALASAQYETGRLDPPSGRRRCKSLVTAAMSLAGKRGPRPGETTQASLGQSPGETYRTAGGTEAFEASAVTPRGICCR